MKPWSSEEIAQLKVLYAQQISTKAIAQALGRTPNSIAHQIACLRKSREITPRRQFMVECFHFKLQPKDAQKLREKMEKSGHTISSYLRMIVLEHLKRTET